MIFSKLWFRVLWLVIIGLTGFHAIKQLQVETNILKLLPQYESELTNELMGVATERVNKQLVLMASAKSDTDLKEHFKYQLDAIDNKVLYENIVYQIDANQMSGLYAILAPHRFNFLSHDDAILRQQKGYQEHLLTLARESLYGVQMLSQEQLTTDPLFTFQRFMSSFGSLNQMALDVSEGYFMVEQSATEQPSHMLAFVELASSAFLPDNQNAVHSDIINMRKQLAEQGVELKSFGAVMYAHQAFQDAKKEISTVGVGSLLAIVALITLAFRSVSPLLLSLSAIALGLLVALGVTVWVFGAIHVFALVFGATIAGVSIDYCFHYWVDAHFRAAEKKPFDVTQLLPALFIGFGSSALVYLGFLLTQYNVLAQIAVFSVTGLLAVLMNVVCLFPWIHKATVKPAPKPFERFSELVINNPIQRLLRSPSWVLGLLFTAMGCLYLIAQPNDDVRDLQHLSPTLKAEEQAIRNALDWQPIEQYVLVHDDSMSGLLQTEAKVLKMLESQGVDVLGVSDFIPPVETQLLNFQAMKATLESAAGQQYFQELGMAVPEPVDFKPFALNQITSPPLSTLFNQRLLGTVLDQYGLLIPVQQPISLPDDPHFSIIQQAEDTSALFAQFRMTATWVLSGAVLVLLLGLSLFKYGFIQSLHLVLLPLLGGVVAMLFAAVAGLHLSLFSVLAVLLILGMGLDYVVFLTESQRPQTIMMAMLLAGTTTVLAFGLLALSHVPVLKSFGFMVGVGMVWVLMTAPAILDWRNRDDS